MSLSNLHSADLRSSTSPKSDTEAIIEAVGSDPEARPWEREASIRYDADSDLAVMYSAHPTDVRSLLRHEHFVFDWLAVTIDGLHYQAEGLLEAREMIEDTDDDDETDVRVTGIQGKLPVGCLTVKPKPRKSTKVSRIVRS